MFGWLKKKQKNELRKLFYQNLLAADFLIVFFAVTGEVATVVRLRKFQDDTRRIASSSDGRPVSHDDLHALLAINWELRRLHEGTADWKSFDQAFQPLENWDAYYKRCDDRETGER